MLTVRPARLDEADALTRLCLRSKAHWGYDTAFLAASRPALTITAARIARGRVLVAQDDGRLAGIAAAEPLPAPGVFDLAHLFVDPAFMRRGVGKALFDAIVALIRREGATTLRIEADPHATGFYERQGAARTGDAPSDSIAGRLLPVYEIAIA